MLPNLFIKIFLMTYDKILLKFVPYEWKLIEGTVVSVRESLGSIGII